MPVKFSPQEIIDGHANSVPLSVIIVLQQIAEREDTLALNDMNHVLTLAWLINRDAAQWLQDNPDKYLLAAYEAGRHATL